MSLKTFARYIHFNNINDYKNAYLRVSLPIQSLKSLKSLNIYESDISIKYVNDCDHDIKDMKIIHMLDKFFNKKNIESNIQNNQFTMPIPYFFTRIDIDTYQYDYLDLDIVYANYPNYPSQVKHVQIKEEDYHEHGNHIEIHTNINTYIRQHVLDHIIITSKEPNIRKYIDEVSITLNGQGLHNFNKRQLKYQELFHFINYDKNYELSNNEIVICFTDYQKCTILTPSRDACVGLNINRIDKIEFKIVFNDDFKEILDKTNFVDLYLCFRHVNDLFDQCK